MSSNVQSINLLNRNNYVIMFHKNKKININYVYFLHLNT